VNLFPLLKTDAQTHISTNPVEDAEKREDNLLIIIQTGEKDIRHEIGDKDAEDQSNKASQKVL
jgi:hypothetical protein